MRTKKTNPFGTSGKLKQEPVRYINLRGRGGSFNH